MDPNDLDYLDLKSALLIFGGSSQRSEKSYGLLGGDRMAVLEGDKPHVLLWVMACSGLFPGLTLQKSRLALKNLR